jgi:ZIP family zinc transporter
MADIFKVLLYSLVSGATIIIGGIFARLEAFPDSQLKNEISHGIVALGGGVLVAAVAFVLAPRAIDTLSLIILILTFVSGSICFLFIDRYIAERGGRGSQLMAMVMDFIPEAIALGAIFANEPRTGLLLAIFIGMQNLPEGYNSFDDLVSSGFSVNKSLLILIPFSLTGILASVCGFLFLNGQEQLVASLMSFAGGGILYLVFQDIAPMAKVKNHWTPAIGATIGFMFGMIGEKLIS